MKKETIETANNILKQISEHKKAIEMLEEFVDKGGALFKARQVDGTYNVAYNPIDFEDFEIRLIIQNKKQRIAALENELERL